MYVKPKKITLTLTIIGCALIKGQKGDMSYQGPHIFFFFKYTRETFINKEVIGVPIYIHKRQAQVKNYPAGNTG